MDKVEEWGVDPAFVDDWTTNSFEYEFFEGIKWKFPICCILWFCVEHDRLGYKIPELSDPETPWHLWGMERIMCPDCMVKYMGGFNE